MILHHLQQQHASFLRRNSLTCLQIHRDGTFALSSRIRGWKIWWVVEVPLLPWFHRQHMPHSRFLQLHVPHFGLYILRCSNHPLTIHNNTWIYSHRALPVLHVVYTLFMCHYMTNRSHQDKKKKQQWLLVHTSGIFSQYLIPNSKSDIQRTRIVNKVDMFVRRLDRFGK